MGLIILIIIICIPILEIIVFIEVGDRIGLFNTIFTILLTTIVGFSLMRSQGLSVLLDAQVSLKQNKFPVEIVFDGLCIIFAGILLITPGFVTDTVGFLFFLPPLRNYLKLLGITILKNRNQVPFSPNIAPDCAADKIIDGDYHDITKYKKTTSDKHDGNNL